MAEPTAAASRIRFITFSPSFEALELLDRLLDKGWGCQLTGEDNQSSRQQRPGSGGEAPSRPEYRVLSERGQRLREAARRSSRWRGNFGPGKGSPRGPWAGR